MRRALALMLICVAGSAAGAALPANGVAKTLRQRATHFSVRAPAGFKLSYKARQRVYVIVNRRRRARVAYMRLRTGASPASAGAALLQQAGATVLDRSGDAKHFRVRVRSASGQVTVEVRREGSGLALTTYGTTAKKAGTAALLDQLARIARTARGGRAVRLPRGQVPQRVQPIALRDFTTQDGLASARVPADPGWNCSGTKGAVECYNDTRGELTLGIPAILCIPGSLEALWGVCPVNADLQTSDQALVSVWPQVRNLAPGGALTKLQITQVKPAGLPGFSSGLYVASFRHGGVPWTGAFLVGTTPVLGSGTWLMYVSAISAPDSDDSSVAQALVASWRSWDPGAAVDDRIESTRTTLQATADDIAAVDHFRQKVFQKVNDNWGEIFRNGADANLNLRPCQPAGPTC